MSTAVMWLLLFVVVALGILIAALSKTKFTTQKIATIGIMAALSFVAYEFFRIPNVLGTGSSFHLGNTFTALTALMLDGVSGGLAGAIGLALADIMAGDPGYAITTFILKFIIGIVCGVFAHKVFKLQDLSAADGVKYYVAVIGSAFSGLLVNVFTDPFLGYFRNRYIFGQEADLASTVAKITSGVTLINSLLSTVCAVVLTLLTNTFVAYAVARNMDKRFFRFLYYFFLAMMFVPFTVVMLPIAKEMGTLHLDNQLGLIILYTILGIGTNLFIAIGFIRSIPISLEEAARIDGASTWRIFWTIIFPLMGPINATIAILTALWAWNDFLLPLITLTDQSNQTIPLAQYVFQSQFTSNYPMAFASYLMAMAPVLIVYVFAQKWVVGGVMRGAVK